MRYGFDKSGGFAVVDDSKRVGSFAFPTSTLADKAKTDPEGTARAMLADVWKDCPADIQEEHYRLSCEAINRS